jgi:hypothetical protein
MSKLDASARSRLERYLLGDVSDEERVEIEETYFADDEEFESLMEIHDDLVDSYARGLLTPEERERFERRYLISEAGVERVEFARTLARKTSRRRISARRLAVAASIALVALAAAWLVFVSVRRSAAPPAREHREQAVTPHGPQFPPTPPPAIPHGSPPRATAETAVMTLLLSPAGTRESGASTDLVLRPAPQWVRVELLVEDDRFDSYGVELQDVEGRVLWSEKSLRARASASNRIVATRVPAKLLPPGDYVVILRGVRGTTSSDISNYTFTVVARPARG